MAHSSWKRHVAVAVLAAAPLMIAGSGSASAQPSAAETQRATTLFVKGTDLLKLKKYPQALEQFKQSYALVPSPNSHLYIARCLKFMGQTRAAYVEYDKVYEEASARA